MALITDPDLLAQASEVTITTATKKIDLNIAGDLSTDGVTLKCLYSFLKEEWKSDAALIKFPFPMTPITDEQFEFINDWDLVDDDARNLVRTAGWAVRNPSGVATGMWAGVMTLGTLPGTAQVYFIQEDQPDATTTDIILDGVVNQAVQVYSDPNADGNPADGFDYRGFLKLFVREWGDTYASSNLVDIGVSQLTYQAYRFPLTTTADPKIQEAVEANADASPYDDVDVTWIVGTGFLVAAARTYVADEVAKDTAGRWFICTVGGSLDTNGVADYTNNGGTGTFAAYGGERQIPGVGYFPFSVIIDGNVDDANPNQVAEDIYTRVAWLLDQATDMDEGSGTRNGNVTDLLLRFVGDTLITAQGVWIDDFLATDINRITFTDSAGATHTFLYTASLILNFGANLVADADAIYRVFFTNDDAGANAGNDYGTSGAILVQDASSSDMAAAVGGQAQIVRTYAYDSNVQRGSGSDGDPAPITVVAIGLSTGQFVSATGTIERSVTNAVALVAALERNYANPA